MKKMKPLGTDSAEHHGKLDAEWDDMGKKAANHMHMMKDIERIMIYIWMDEHESQHIFDDLQGRIAAR